MVVKLLGYCFDIVYKSGLDNRGVDTLFRMHDITELQPIVYYPEWLGSQTNSDEVHQNDKLEGIIDDLQQRKSVHSGFPLWKGILLYEERLVVAYYDCIPILMQELHFTT